LALLAEKSQRVFAIHGDEKVVVEFATLERLLRQAHIARVVLNEQNIDHFMIFFHGMAPF
jgi:hypothetical protein